MLEKEKPGVLILHKWKRDFEELSDTELRTIIYALIDYSESGIVPEFEDRSLRMMFREYMDVTDYNTEKWNIRKISNSINGKKGGAPKGNKNAKKQPKTTDGLFDQAKQAKQAIKTKIPTTTPITTDNINNNININEQGDTNQNESEVVATDIIDDDFIAYFTTPH